MTMDHLARREAALRAAGIEPSIMAPEILAVVELKQDPPPPPPNNSHGLPYRAQTRRLSDDEWNRLAPQLIDQPQAKITNRRFLEMMLRFVVEGDSWSKLGSRDKGGLREKRRRHRGDKRWDEAGQLALLTFDDLPFAEQVARTCRWITHNDVTMLALRRGVGPAVRRWKVIAGSPTKPLA